MKKVSLDQHEIKFKDDKLLQDELIEGWKN